MPPKKRFGGGETRTGIVGVSPRARGVRVEARNLPARTKLSWKRGGVKHAGGQVPLPRPRGVSAAAAAAAVLASAIDVEDENSPPWRPDGEYASGLLFDVISSRSALSDAGNDGQLFAHLQSITHTDMGGRSENRRQAGRVPARVLAALLAAEPQRVGGKVSTGLRGHGMEGTHHRRGHSTVVTKVRGGQPRGVAV